MRILLLVSLFFSGLVFAQNTPEVERFWLTKDANLHTSVKSLVFFQLDSLLQKDTNKIQFRVLPDEVFSFNIFRNNTSEFKFQKGFTFTLNGNFSDKVSYMFDCRIGTSNQPVVPYNSTFQTKSFFFDNVKIVNPLTAYSVYGDLRGRVQYKPNSILTFTAGIDKLFIGEGDRSLLFGNQGVAAPFASMVAKFNKLEYHFVQQIWRERSGNHYEPKGNATHYISYKPTKKWSIGLFETVVYQMKDTLYNRGFEVEYLNPLIFYRPQEYNMGSADNIILGLNLSYTHKNTMFYGQLMIDDFLLSAIMKHNKWWSNKYGFQLGLKGWKDLDSTTKLFYRTEINMVRPYTYSQKNSGGVMGNQGLPVAHPLGSNFFEIYQEVSFHRKKWSFETWIQCYVKGDDFYSTSTSPSMGGDIYRPYNLHPNEYGNVIGQGKTTHIMQIGTYISRKIKYQRIFFDLITLPKMLQSNQLSIFIEPKVRFSNIEGDTFSNFYFTFGTIKTLGRDRRNY
jgi:hypothetical protein